MAECHLSGEPAAHDESTRIDHVDVDGVVEGAELRVDRDRPESNY